MKRRQALPHPSTTNFPSFATETTVRMSRHLCKFVDERASGQCSLSTRPPDNGKMCTNCTDRPSHSSFYCRLLSFSLLLTSNCRCAPVDRGTLFIGIRSKSISGQFNRRLVPPFRLATKSLLVTSRKRTNRKAIQRRKRARKLS